MPLPINYSDAYTLLENGSFVQAGATAYQASLGVLFWPILTMVMLVAVGIRTENPAIVAVLAIISHVVMASFLPVETSPIFYGSIVLSIGVTLYTLFMSRKTG